MDWRVLVVRSQSRKSLGTLRSIHTVFECTESDVEQPLQVGVHLSLLPVDLVMGRPVGGTTWLGVIEHELRSEREHGYEEAVLPAVGVGRGRLRVMHHQGRGAM